MEVTLTTDRQQRDLAWSLFSQPLVSRGDPRYVWPAEDWFRSLPLPEIAELPVPRDLHHFRLGQHFENLLRTWLSETREFSLIDANLQVFNGQRRTVGEFDYLVQTPQQVEHWEAAVKFYLGTGSGDEMSNWYGPNTADRLDIKYQRLIDHQLCLANQEDAAALLAGRLIAVQSARCFMKGRLFHPFNRWVSREWHIPDAVNPQHERGWWLHRDQLTSETFPDALFAWLPKLYWLSPARGDLPGMDYKTLRSHLDQTGREPATHLVVLDPDGNETSRGFIVDDRWIQHTQSR